MSNDARPVLGQQRLHLTGLRFAANLGILDHEKRDPQPIQVDAELNLGQQPLHVYLQLIIRISPIPMGQSK